MTSPDRTLCPVPHRPSYCKGALGRGRPDPGGFRTQDAHNSESGRASGQLSIGPSLSLEQYPALPAKLNLWSTCQAPPTRDTGVVVAASTQPRGVSTLRLQPGWSWVAQGSSVSSTLRLLVPLRGSLRLSGQISQGQSRNSVCLVFLLPGPHPHRTPGAALAATPSSRVKPVPPLRPAFCT